MNRTEVETPGSLIDHIPLIPDPRIEKKCRHKLVDIVAISICAILCGADDRNAIEGFGKTKKDWFKNFLELPSGISSHGTFRRLSSILSPEAFEQFFSDWVPSHRQDVDRYRHEPSSHPESRPSDFTVCVFQKSNRFRAPKPPSSVPHRRRKKRKRVFGIDIETCPACGGAVRIIARIYDTVPLTCPVCGATMRIIAFITETATVLRILDHIGEPHQPPLIHPPRGPPGWIDAQARVFLDEELDQDRYQIEFDQRLTW